MLNQIDIKTSSNRDSKMMANFEFGITPQFICLECKTKWTGNSEIIFPIHINKDVSISKAIKSSMMYKIDGYNCEHCKKITSLKVKEEFICTSNILMIVNKCYSSVINKKINHAYKVDYTLLIKGFKYILSSIIIHQGSSLCYGHYYTLCKRKNDWYEINDNSFKKVPREEFLKIIKHLDAYIFFYERE
ncbi:Ubiquitin carboxyl-terminal hydrolase 25 [Astathelohania contejeani]|uniref:Ubiquitin carboxyl-terminal hydrolase 25 n=1 Tax=Astathelohania contejeani TaxID=164912 RepID=A0ABQ7HW56_9MICR|nr:Ubiquitin carboxyl-terminal hydrolase 25 [Thelohania contejeani]